MPRLLAPPDWSVQSFLRFCGELRQRQFDILHLHYPSIGNRHSLCPHLLGVARLANRVVVTLHEHSYMPILQRASTHVFRCTADLLLFTTEAELMSYGRSGIMRRVIHLGSSVPAWSVDLLSNPTVLYFGQIRPKKGLEELSSNWPAAVLSLPDPSVSGSLEVFHRGAQAFTNTCGHAQGRKSNG